MERPILMTTESVKAILDGRKTMTRRVVKDPRRPSRERDAFLSGSVGKSSIADLQAEAELYKDIKPNFPCPYGQVGDRLWVRETWCVESFMDGEPMLFAYKDGQTMEEDSSLSDTLDYEGWYERVCIQSTEDAAKAFKQGLVRRDDECYHWDIGKSPCRWRPSIFMPRWASRLILEIIEVRVERLQEILKSDERNKGSDIYAEGVDYMPPYAVGVFGYNIYTTFRAYWDSLNLKRGYGWDKNPWCWVIKFDNIGVRAK